MLKASFTIGLIGLTLVACSDNSPSEPASARSDKSGSVREEVIYGNDDRHEFFEETDPALKALSESTVALVKKSDVSAADPSGFHSLRSENFGSAYGLCTAERFSDQNISAFCSGFLVGPDLVVTAGHCISSLLDCSETSFVFDFAYKSKNASPFYASRDNVYSCKEVIHTEASPIGSDFAIVRLDRSVVNRTPLKLRESGEVQKGEGLTVMGHPAGLPLKIAGGAEVRDASPATYFVANLDTYGGNSGSAVFNTQTLEVEGVLVRGENDFEWSPDGCATSYVCKNEGCRGEDVTKITEAFKILTSL